MGFKKKKGKFIGVPGSCQIRQKNKLEGWLKFESAYYQEKREWKQLK